MQFFAFHIGDYRAATAHLSNEEDLAYMRLLLVYYDTERALPNDPKMLSRRLRVSASAIQTVFSDFFKLGDDGLMHHARCDAELARWYERSESAKSAANLRWSEKPFKNKESTDAFALRSHCDGIAFGMLPINPLTHDPLPTTQKVKIIGAGTAPTGADAPDWLPAIWSAYLQHRKQAKKPLTPTAQKAAIGKLRRMLEAGQDIEAVITQSIENGWTGLFEVKQNGSGNKKIGVAEHNAGVIKQFLSVEEALENGKK